MAHWKEKDPSKIVTGLTVVMNGLCNKNPLGRPLFFGGWVAFGRLLVGRLVVSQFIDSNAIVYIWYINFV